MTTTVATQLAELLQPCPAPDTMAGFDLCPCLYGGSWPCQTTRAAWLARGLDPATEVRRVLAAQVAAALPDLDADATPIPTPHSQATATREEPTR
jgi:hypothetical protein